MFRVYDVVRETMHSAISATKTGGSDITLNDFEEVIINYLHILLSTLALILIKMIPRDTLASRLKTVGNYFLL